MKENKVKTVRFERERIVTKERDTKIKRGKKEKNC